MNRKILFVGEKRSDLAIKKGWRWEDGRLAAKQLFDALDYCHIPVDICHFTNWFEEGGPNVVRGFRKDNHLIVGMGRKVCEAMHADGLRPFIELIHPAARGAVRKKEVYCEHVKEQLNPFINCELKRPY